MKKKYFVFGVTLIAASISMAVSLDENKSRKTIANKSFCVDVSCKGGKRHYEQSPPVFSMSEAIRVMKMRYPDCRISGASDSSCK